MLVFDIMLILCQLLPTDPVLGQQIFTNGILLQVIFHLTNGLFGEGRGTSHIMLILYRLLPGKQHRSCPRTANFYQWCCPDKTVLGQQFSYSDLMLKKTVSYCTTKVLGTKFKVPICPKFSMDSCCPDESVLGHH